MFVATHFNDCFASGLLRSSKRGNANIDIDPFERLLSFEKREYTPEGRSTNAARW